MSMQANGIIFYGWLFEKDYEFPWSECSSDLDLDVWWRDVSGGPKSIFTSEGDYLPGVTRDDSRKYFEDCKVWDKVNPYPFVLINYDYGQSIAIKNSSTYAWERPKKIDLDFNVNQEDVEKTKEICKKYEIELNGEPEWYLVSYLG